MNFNLDQPVSVTPTDRNAALQILLAVAEAIRELQSVPSGHLYARLIAMPPLTQMTADQYQQMIGSLKGAGLVEERNYLLTWVGPKAVQQ